MSNKKTIVVTGGAGYIGSHAVRRFLEDGHRVLLFDNFSKGHRQVGDILSPLGDLKVVEGDLFHDDDLNRLFEDENVDAVIHLAAPCIVHDSMSNPKLYFDKNVVGTLNLLEAMHRFGVKKLIFSSTCAVYANNDNLPIHEKHHTMPDSVYGEVKLMAEKLINWYGRLHDIEFVIFRFFNACGAASDGLVGDSKKPSALLMQNAVRGGLGLQPFEMTCGKVDTHDGTPIRDYVDVEDLVDAMNHAIAYLESGKPSDTFNIGNGRGYSVKEIVNTVEKILNVNIERKQGETRIGELASAFSDTTKMREQFGWQPKKSLEESIKSLITWYQNHPNGYDY